MTSNGPCSAGSALTASKSQAHSSGVFRLQRDTWIFLAFWVLAVAPGVWTTQDLRWPYDADGFRDVSIAQNIREGRWLRDPLYVGEAAWYSPLVPSIIAVASECLKLEMPEAYARLGAWLNAFAPVAFWLCVRRLLGHGPALFAVCAFMFLPGRPPAWASATYSPWLFPSITAQIPLYLGLFVVFKTADTRVLMPRLLLGVLLAATFLAHTAAGILLGATALSTTFWYSFKRGTAFTARGAGATIIPYVVAGFLIAPFLFPIASRYGFQILNRAPATWSDNSLQLTGTFLDLQRPGSVIQVLLATWGAVAAYKTRGAHACFILLVWGSVAALGFWYALVTERAADLPTLVPAFHFYFILRAWKWVLFGSGMTALANATARGLARFHLPHGSQPEVTLFAAVALVLSIYPRYVGREAFTSAPEVSRQLAQLDGHVAYRWIRANTDASAVFLSDDDDALRVIGPAGRSVVCVSPFFSNPYVDYSARSQARDILFASLLTGDDRSFRQVSRPFGVTHVLARSSAAHAIRLSNAGILQEVFATGTIVIFRVVGVGYVGGG
jgi:hypothetical protein